MYGEEISIFQIYGIFIINPHFQGEKRKNIPFGKPFTICPNEKGL